MEAHNSSGVRKEIVLIKFTWCAAGYTNDLGLAVAYEYEPLRDVKTLVSNAWSTNPISTFAYTYDAIGRRTQRIDDSSITNLFGYNLRSELVSAEMGTNTYAYACDPIGNRSSASENGTTTTYAANSLNQYTALNPASTNPTPFTYDPDGNMTQYGDLAFFWDAENRLLGVASNGIALVTNRYDFMSRRIEKATSTATNTFLYDGWNLLRETTSSTSAFTTNHYVWGLDLSCTLHDAGGVGGLLMQHHSDYTSPCFSCCDANGNITDLLDEDGSPVARYEYDTFGNTTVQSGNREPDNSFRFSTKPCDEETGLCYYGYRFYHLRLGRWVKRDPYGESGGNNLVGFANNDAINGIDIFGLQCCCKCLSAAISSWNWVIESPSNVEEAKLWSFLGYISHRVGLNIHYDFETQGEQGCTFVQREYGNLTLQRNSGGRTIIKRQEFDGHVNEISGSMVDESGASFAQAQLLDAINAEIFRMVTGSNPEANRDYHPPDRPLQLESGVYELKYHLDITIECHGSDGSHASATRLVESSKQFTVSDVFVDWVSPE